jgi:hypothetical protein
VSGNRKSDSDAKALASERWFGYGRWGAPYWFVGMEPGGNDTHSSYDAWLALGGDELIDCRSHHLWKRDALGVEDRLWTRWHDGDRPPTQPTWRPLIQALLAFKGQPSALESVRSYQRDHWGMLADETAVIELNALHAPNNAAKVDRETHRPQRIRTIRERMVEYRPTFAIFYGKDYRPFYEQIVGSPFGDDGFARSGETICALVPHPARSGKRREWWTELGRRLQTMSKAGKASK